MSGRNSTIWLRLTICRGRDLSLPVTTAHPEISGKLKTVPEEAMSRIRTGRANVCYANILSRSWAQCEGVDLVMSQGVLRILVIKYGFVGLTSPYLESSTFIPLAELARRGHQVTFFAPTTSKSTQRRTVPGLNLELVILPREVSFLSIVFFEFVAFCRLLKSVARSDVVILDPRLVPTLFPVLLLRRSCSHNPVLMLHIESNVVFEGTFLHALSLKLLDALSTKLASILFDKVLFSSPMMGALYDEMYGISTGKIAVWPNSVEPSFTDFADETKAALLRKELGLEGRFGFLYHGALSKRRGTIELVEAFRILKERSVKATLVLLGYGPQREAISKYVRVHHLEDVVKLRGPVDHSEVPSYIAACDVGIVALPDHIMWRYQCPIKILEMLAMNKPLIVSDLPAHRWIIGNEPVAVYLKGTDPRAIADGVCTFLRSPNGLDPTLGKKIIQERFTPEKIADTLESQILGSRLRKDDTPVA